MYRYRLPLLAFVCVLWLATTPTATGDDSDAAQEATLADINKSLDLLSSKLERLTVSLNALKTGSEVRAFCPARASAWARLLVSSRYDT